MRSSPPQIESLSGEWREVTGDTRVKEENGESVVLCACMYVCAYEFTAVTRVSLL